MKKFITILCTLIISLCAVIFVACGESFDKFSLRFSSQEISMALDEEKNFDIIVENYSNSDLHFAFDMDKEILTIDKDIKDLGEGRYRIKVKAAICDRTTLTITQLESKKTLAIPVVVYEKVASFSMKDSESNSLYVVRGEKVTFKSQMFNFSPETTTQTELMFSVGDEILQNNTFVATDTTPDTVRVVATSVYDANITTTFNLRVFDKIQTEGVYLTYNGQKIPTIKSKETEVITQEESTDDPVEDEEDYVIELIANNNASYSKTFGLVFEDNQTYKYQIFSKKLQKTIATYTQSNFENMLFVDIQASDFVGDDTLVVRITYADFDGYAVDLEYAVKVVYAPKHLKISGIEEEFAVDLFDNGAISKVHEDLISIEPIEAIYDSIKIEFYFKATNPETHIVTLTPTTYNDVREYICVKYRNMELENDQIFDDLSSSIEYYGRKVIPAELGEQIVMRFVCSSDYLEQPIQNQISATIHKSPTEFRLDTEKYKNSTLYVKNGETVVFDDFVLLEEDAYIGELNVSSDNYSKTICSVVQNTYNTTQIKITALSVGEANYTIVLASGVSTRIRIVVKEELDVDNFWLYTSAANTDKIAMVEYKQLSNVVSTLDVVALRGLAEFEIIPNILPKNIDNSMYSLEFISENPDVISVEGKKIRSLVADNNRYEITVILVLKTIEDFAIVDVERDDLDRYNFNVICFEPISTMSLIGLNNSDVSGAYSSDVDVYDARALGYVDQPMSRVSFKLLIGDKVASDVVDPSMIEWEFSVSKENKIGEPNKYILTESGDVIYGEFDVENLIFVCDSQYGRQIFSKTFTITARIKEYGKIISTTCKINIKRYVEVENIWFYNYVDSIYLDAVNDEVVLYPYIYPLNATNKNFVVYFEPDQSSNAFMVTVDYNQTEIRVRYSGTGGGSGVIRIIPTSSFKKDDPSSYDLYKEIEVNVGDGRINSPIHIGTWEQFKNIDLSKHYVIDTIIDAGGEVISPLGELTGGIKGYTKTGTIVENVGGIINFTISTPYRDVSADYYGLFSKISETGYLMNLRIKANINIELPTNDSYIGVIAGENNGLIKNVTVVLDNSTILTNSNQKLYVGGMVGKNNYLIISDTVQRGINNETVQTISDKDNETRRNGTPIDSRQVESSANGVMKINYDSYPSNSTLMTYMESTSSFSLIFTQANLSAEYYFGGVVGVNTGLIKFRKENLIGEYNYYGTNVNVYMNVTGYDNNNYPRSDSSYIGSVAGYNEMGNIVNIVASGRIRAATESNVGGITGCSKNSKILNNISRVFVRGTKYVGGIVGIFQDTELMNNIVQATDDRRAIGLDASLIVAETASVNIIGYASASSVDASNKIYSYVYRTSVDTSIQKLESINEFYGEVIKNASGVMAKIALDTHVLRPSLVDAIDKTRYPNNSIVLSYYEAKNSSEQKYIQQKYNVIDFPNIFTDTVAINIESKSSSIITVSEYGKLNILSTGVCVLTLSSIYNRDDKLDITCYVINKVDSVYLYSSADGQIIFKDNSIDNVLQLTNRNTEVLYPKFVSRDLIVGNMRLSLVENNELMFDVIGNEYVIVNQSGRSIVIRGSGAQNSVSSENIKIYPYILINGQKRYATLQVIDGRNYIGEYIEYSGDIATSEDLYYQDIKMSYTQGIYNIDIDKSNVTLVPSDSLSLRVYYNTDDSLDKLALSINYITGSSFYNVDFSDDTSMEVIHKYFRVIDVTEPVFVSGNRYYVDFTFELNYEYDSFLKDYRMFLGDYEFVFSGNNNLVNKSLNIKYIEQPINNIIVKNYSYTDNEGEIEIRDEQTLSYYYSTRYTLTETQIATAGQANILKINVAPEYANYAYIELTNADSNISGEKVVLFGLLKPGSEEYNKQVLSTEAYFIPNGMRIMKSSVTNGEVNVIYRLTTNVLDGDTLTLYVNFYNEDGELLYATQQKDLMITIDKAVSVTIANKKSRSGSELSYYVARGYTYVLDVQLSGYQESDIVIETSSPYADVYYDHGTYYLQIANEVSYIGGNYEGIDFVVTYYGKHLVNGVMTDDVKKSFVCTIVEYTVDNLDDLSTMFYDRDIYINLGNAYDVRDLIIDKIYMEYAADAIYAVNELKQSIKNDAFFYYSVNNTFIGNMLTSESMYPREGVTGNYFGINGYDITGKRVGENVVKLGFYARLQYNNGYLIVSVIDEQQAQNITDLDIYSFNVTVNQRTSSEHPLPIYSYEELLKMSDDNYYILMNNISLPSDFTPLKVKLAKFDGNNKKIIFHGAYQEYLSISDFGLFETIDENMIVANLVLSIEDDTTMFTFRNETLTTAFNFGLLAAKNEGVITNCKVAYANESSLIVVNNAPVQATDISYIAPLVAVNSGYITNSQVNVRIEGRGGGLGGFVGVNSGHIASSYVKQSMIKNSSTNVNNATAGFAVINSGKILTSFIEGTATGGSTMYASSRDYIVQATSIAGAFIYSNDGDVSDCYANIPVNSSSLTSGFICNNSGKVSRCYTTSKMTDRDTSNYPVVIQNSGSFEECYYLEDANLTSFNYMINTSNAYISGINKINVVEFALGYKSEYNNGQYTISDEKIFAGFAFNSNNDVNKGNWFYARNVNVATKETFRSDNYIIRGTNYRKYFMNSVNVAVTSYRNNGVIQSFVSNRPQLVAPNLIAYSIKVIDEVNTKYNEETGETEYAYEIVNSDYSEGSIYNPYIISSASDFEDKFVGDSNKFINNQHYRFIKDIDYQKDGLTTSALYKYIMDGYIEGNGMTIANFSINSNESLLSSGYFAQIGSGVNFATIQNLTLAPKYINLPNAVNVGVLAGTISRGYAYGINIDGYMYNRNGIVVLGKNVVGGILGRTINSFDIIDVTSSVSTNAYQTCTRSDWSEETTLNEEILYDENGVNNGVVSYSGSIIGFAGGTGIVESAKISNVVAVVGMVAGFMFGGIGTNVTVRQINFVPIHDDQNFVRASAFGGLLVGDLKGKLENVVIGEYQDYSDVSSTYSESPIDTYYEYIPFRIVPKVPMAVGGLAGISRGGKNTIDNCVVYENVVFSNSTSTIIPSSVGGFVGRVEQYMTIQNSRFAGKYIDGSIKVGGLIGEYNFSYEYYVNDEPLKIINTQISHSEAKIKLTKENPDNPNEASPLNLINLQDCTVDIRIVKPASYDETMLYIGSVIGFMSVYTTSIETKWLVHIDNSQFLVCLKSNVAVYGKITDNQNSNSSNGTDKIYCYVFAGGILGGCVYSGERIDSSEIVRSISINLQGGNTIIYISTLLQLKDLRSLGDTKSICAHVYWLVGSTDTISIDLKSKVIKTNPVLSISGQTCSFFVDFGVNKCFVLEDTANVEEDCGYNTFKCE